MDWMAQEQERGITITCCYNLWVEFSNYTRKCYRRRYHFNIIDTQDTLILPRGESFITCIDGLVFLFSAVDGVEPSIRN
jgi:translation elongation factor EF-G